MVVATSSKTVSRSAAKKKSLSSGNGSKSGRSGTGSKADARGGTGWRYYLRALGPGLVTGASDDDPSGIATYSQAGASQGFALLWTTWVTFPLMAAVQEICDRTALATGKSLGELATAKWRRPLPRTVIGVLLVALMA